MALQADSGLTATPDPAVLPATITFQADVLDPDAKSVKEHEIELRLAESNKLKFANGTKSVTQTEKIGKTPVTVSIRARVVGPDPNIFSFNVSMRDENGNEIVSGFVEIG